MEFVISNALSPNSLDPANQDERILGLCFWQLEFHGEPADLP
jgi:hypothetical protein